MVTPTDPRTALRAGLTVRPAEVQRPLKGIVMIVLAVLIFSLIDANIKHLTARFNVPAVVALRYIFSTLILLVFVLPREGWNLFRAQRKGQVLLRSLAMTLASVCAAQAYFRLPMAQTTAIIYLAPFGVLLLSGLILGERVRLASWLAASGGFCGLLLITRPGGGLDPLGIAFALAAAAFSVWYYLSSRLLARSESTLAMLFYTNLTGAVVLGAVLPFNLDFAVVPGLLDLVQILLVSAFAVISHFLVTAAYREAPASLLSPMLYMQLISSGLIGWIAFGNVPDAWATLGIAIVAISGAGLALWNRFRDQG